MTFDQPFVITPIKQSEKENWFATDATPATCIKIGLEMLLKEKPDLVVSGINKGDNLGVMTFSSGTVGCAREACFKGIPAMAVSLAKEQDPEKERVYLEDTADFMVELINEMRERGWKSGRYLNINYSNLPRHDTRPYPDYVFRDFRPDRLDRSGGTEDLEDLQRKIPFPLMPQRNLAKNHFTFVDKKDIMGKERNLSSRRTIVKKLIFLTVFGCFIFSFAAFSAANANPTLGQEKFTVKEVPAFSYCCLPCQGPFTNMEAKIGELTQFLQMQNIAPMGPLIGIFYNDPNVTKPENLNWELGFPVMESNVQDPLRFRQWTFTTVLEGTYTGPYEKSAGIYAEMMGWLEANGYIPAGPIMEKYLSDPNSTRPEDIKTEIWIPCRKK